MTTHPINPPPAAGEGSMSDGADDALASYIRAGMPLNRNVGKACPHCGRWSYTRNQCHPEQNLFCAGHVIHERPSTNDKASPEVGPQAEASPAGTGAGTLAGREGRHEGEAVSADLPTNPKTKGARA